MSNPHQSTGRQDSVNAVRSGVSGLALHVPHSLLTVTEKQVHLRRLHMRPIQWHLKNNWRVPESLEKVMQVPRLLHPHLKWWLEESNVQPGQPLPSKACSADLYRRIKRRVGRSCKLTYCKGNLVPSRKQVAHKPPEGGLSGLKRV